ncbi:tRNA glutamyl-Q(34) synthetase GluQRS [Methylophilus sp. TWE2]|uniref:tRNA glutamyl-Q(34) synthetase GluQRS n=1 Tax=Methylophilus sp. TWE2 TaxID=1662285 RepID=UPI00067181DD|nr:tRNA glutamyl-Q(34) synthetase GluQRS [Methylophilus sp. TWE2]AKR43803.1 glutamyl-Q tRNA(Asp) ligase [Methylophilus sp. TWE2]
MVIGRFAPSPTGPLHFGSLVAAVASYCDAKSQGGKWLLRIEDVDITRRVEGASDDIIRTLQRYGFEWDGAIVYQSQRSEYYEHALTRLRHLGLAYPCTCSRKEIADSSTQKGIEGVIYPGTCLHHPIKPNTSIAWRLKTPAKKISFEDRIVGWQEHNIGQDIGDFVIKRADGLFNYQLAVVVDDAMQGITHVVRGADLLQSTTRQIYLQQCLGYAPLAYAHIPLVLNNQGQKLSKQTMAASVANSSPAETIYQALCFLQQSPPDTIKNATLNRVWRWAISNWNANRLAGA